MDALSRISDFRSSAAGTARDVREHTNLELEIPFFGSRVEAASFVAIALGRAIALLPQTVHYVDFGGGQGILAREMTDALIGAGRTAITTVVDANPSYLADARARGLQVALENIESCTMSDVDLATMRLVIHYCGPDQQASILQRIHRTLAPGGVFVSQIETGEEDVCRLQARIANALSTESRFGYHWPTLSEYIEIARRAGFDEMDVIGESRAVDTSFNEALAAAWRRFHGRELRELASQERLIEMNQLLAQRARFFRESHALIAETFGNVPGVDTQSQGLQKFRLHYPIVFCRRAK